MVHRMKCFEYAHHLTQRNFFLNSFSADTSTLRESSLRSSVIHNSAQNETNQYCKSTVVFHWSGCAVFPSLVPFRWQIWPVQVPCDTLPIHLLPPRPMFWPSFDRIELGSVDHNLNRLFLSHRGIRAKSNNDRSSRIRSICLLRTLHHWIHLLPPQQHWWWSTNNIRTRQLCCRLPMHHQRRIMLSTRNVIVISRDDIFFFFPRSIYIYMNIKLYQWGFLTEESYLCSTVPKVAQFTRYIHVEVESCIQLSEHLSIIENSLVAIELNRSKTISEENVLLSPNVIRDLHEYETLSVMDHLRSPVFKVT